MRCVAVIGALTVQCLNVSAQDSRVEINDGFAHGRDRLTSAHCRIRRVLQQIGFDEQDDPSVEDLEAWYRFGTGETRFDQLLNEEEATNFGHLDQSMLRWSWIRNGEREYFWRPPATYHFSNDPDAPAIDLGILKPLDVRTVGLTVGLEWMQPQLEYEERLADWLFFPNWDYVTTNRIAENVTVEYRHAQDPSVRRRVTVDPKRDWVPVKDSLQQLTPEGEVVQALVESSVTWTQIAGVWMPEVAVSETFSSGTPDRIQTVRLEFNWLSVNEPIESTVFTDDSWTIPDGIVNVDVSSGEPVATEIRGVSMPNPAALLEQAEDRSDRTWWIVGVNAVLAAVIVIVVLTARRRS